MCTYYIVLIYKAFHTVSTTYNVLIPYHWQNIRSKNLTTRLWYYYITLFADNMADDILKGRLDVSLFGSSDASKSAKVIKLWQHFSTDKLRHVTWKVGGSNKRNIICLHKASKSTQLWFLSKQGYFSFASNCCYNHKQYVWLYHRNELN